MVILVGGRRVSRSDTISSPKMWGPAPPSTSPNIFLTYGHKVRETATKLCMMIKLDDTKFLQGRPRILCDADADARSVCGRLPAVYPQPVATHWVPAVTLSFGRQIGCTLALNVSWLRRWITAMSNSLPEILYDSWTSTDWMNFCW